MTDLINQLANHLWQSTLFAALLAGLAASLRRNQARARYWVWLAASVKFLVPFALLMSLGSTVRIRPATPILAATAVEQITTSFAPAPTIHSTTQPASAFTWPAIAIAVWILGALLVAARWFANWRTLRNAARATAPLKEIAGQIPVLAARTAIEPGVFGILRPVVLLPEGILGKLAPEELDAILRHEIAHIHRRDNLTAAVHMVVETLFWFHPLVWWIGARLVEERERACDETVLAEGGQAEVYANGILSVCKLYMPSPVACASGVSGGELRQRIEAIMTWRAPMGLTLTKKTALAAAAIAAISLPLAIGILRAQTLPPPPKHKFEVASIKLSKDNSPGVWFRPGPNGGLQTQNTSVMELLTFAYDVRPFQIVGAPGWAKSDRYNVVGTPETPESAPSPKMAPAKMEQMFDRQRQRMQALLLERFGLVIRAETREMPIYSLVIGKGGHKLKPAGDGPPNMRTQRGRVMARGANLRMFTNAMSGILGRPVVDETGLQGDYDFEFEWTPDTVSEDGAPGETGPSIFTAIQEKMGLKLESKKGPAPVFVIEKIERPTEN